MKSRFVLLTISLVAACSNPAAPDAGSDVAILSTKTNYVVGESVSAHLFNRSDKPVGYGACSVSLERYDNGKWNHVWPTSGACIAILYLVNGHSNRVLEIPLQSDAPPGTYRLRMEISDERSQDVRSIYSPTFVVRGAA